MTRRSSRKESEDGDDLLARAFEGVEPLRQRPRVTPGPLASEPRPGGIPGPSSAARRAAEPKTPEFEVTSDGEAIAGRVRDLARRALRRLKVLDPTATLDLHGLAVEDARGRVEAFVRRSAEAGHRAILVIHGKGAHSAGVPVLKSEIVGWLTSGHAATRVLAFATAPRKHGGGGALLIFLRG